MCVGEERKREKEGKKEVKQSRWNKERRKANILDMVEENKGGGGKMEGSV